MPSGRKDTAVFAVCQEQTKCCELEATAASRRPCRVPDPTLQKLLGNLVVRYGTQTALAKAIGITDSRLAKVLKGDAGALSVLNCLRLAKVAGLPPSQILRAAGKSEIAALIEDMYGESAQPTISLEQFTREELIEKWWPDLSPTARAALHALLNELAPERRPPKKRRRR